MSGRKAGHPKTGGRKKGSVNRVSQDMRTWLTDFLDSNRKDIERSWKKLDAKDKFQFFEKLMKYTLPTLQSVSAQFSYENLSDEQLDKLFQNLINHANKPTGEDQNIESL